MEMDRKLIHKLLEEYSTKRLFIEYQGCLSNHVSQAIISMVSLGASEPQVKAFVDPYITKLEAPENFLHDLDEDDNKVTMGYFKVKVGEDLAELLGRRKGYHLIKEYYWKKSEGEYLTNIVAKFYPRLCPGTIGVVSHGLIYLGYGFAARCKTTIIEGLSYLHYANMPLETKQDLADPKLGHGPSSILEVLAEVKSSPLEEWMLKKYKQAPWDDFNTSYQSKAGVLMTCKAAELLNYVYQIALPFELLADSNESVESVHKRATSIGTWLVNTTITIFVIAEIKSDFFFLHAITAAWALKQLLPCLQSQADVTKATAAFLTTLIANYVIQGCQMLDTTKLDVVDEPSATWEDIIQCTLEPQKDDEHIYKLVQVCYDMSQMSPDDKDKQKLYKLAAESVLTHDLNKYLTV